MRIAFGGWVTLVILSSMLIGWGGRGLYADEQVSTDPEQLDRIEAKLDLIIKPVEVDCMKQANEDAAFEQAAKDLATRQYKFLEVRGTCSIKKPLRMPSGTSIFGGYFIGEMGGFVPFVGEEKQQLPKHSPLLDVPGGKCGDGQGRVVPCSSLGLPNSFSDCPTTRSATGVCMPTITCPPRYAYNECDIASSGAWVCDCLPDGGSSGSGN